MAATIMAIMPPFSASLETRSQVIDWSARLAEHGRWLRAVILARSREPQAVEEILQEVALAAIRQAAPLEDLCKVAPWLYRLAVHQALMYRRKIGRARRLAGQYGNREFSRSTRHNLDPLGWLLMEERRELVRLAMERLTGKDAEILLLKYTEDWSYRRLAEHLGLSESAVEARLHRARGRLREELAMLGEPAGK